MSKSNKPVFVERGSLAIGLLVKVFKGSTFLDVRNYYDAEGEWKPTAKGLMIPIEHSREVLRAMENLIDPIAPKQSMPKAAKSSDKRTSSSKPLYFISRKQPRFKDGIFKIDSARVSHSMSRMTVLLEKIRFTSYKVFRYDGVYPERMADGFDRFSKEGMTSLVEVDPPC